MEKRTRDIVVGTVAVAAAAIALYFGFGYHGRGPDLNTYEVLGTVTAEETAKLLGGQGEVMVMARDTGAAKIPSVEAEVAAFQKALKKNAGLNLVVERVKLSPAVMMTFGGGIPPQNFLKALEAHPKVGAVVLFFGFPQLGPPELDALKASGLKTVVVSSLRPGYKRLLEREAIQLAVVPRPNASEAGAPAGQTVRERFDREYMLLTPEDAAKLP